MNEVSYTSTLSAEEVISQAVSPEKRQELVERLTKLKATLNQIEDQVAQKEQQQVKALAAEEIDRRILLLEKISSDIRANIHCLAQIQSSELTNHLLYELLKNIEKVNQAHEIILNSLIR